MHLFSNCGRAKPVCVWRIAQNKLTKAGRASDSTKKNDSLHEQWKKYLNDMQDLKRKYFQAHKHVLLTEGKCDE